MSGLFQRTGALNPPRSVFNLSYQKKFTCDMGQLIPVMCDEVVPGDIFKIGNECVLRFQPLIAPIMHEVNVYVHYFFVPNRILWDGWETFITGGIDGNDTTQVLPRWPTDNSRGLGSLWDFLGFPLDVSPTGRWPLDFPRRAYYEIWNQYYRDETLQTAVNWKTGHDGNILNRCWEKDYFTSALPWQQRGTAPSLPLSGLIHPDFTDSFPPGDVPAYVLSALNLGIDEGVSPSQPYIQANNTGNTHLAHDALSKAVVDMGDAITFDVADLRLVFQIQKWMERNARGGARYTEFLRSHFGVSPRDERLQRPEYIGGSKSPVIVSEVLQTSNTALSTTTEKNTPQGNMAGHGISVNQSMCANYRASEYGLIMGIMSIMPRTAYSQGIDRQWLRQSKYDFYFPEFANLSEQAIERVEIFASASEEENKTLFGYQGRYDEMRFKRNMICNQMRTTLDYWHLAREFADAPLLNSSFITCNPSKRVFAVQDEPGLIVNFGNMIKAIRPMPVQSNPGLIDHN